jgi:hypothetical protein
MVGAIPQNIAVFLEKVKVVVPPALAFAVIVMETFVLMVDILAPDGIFVPYTYMPT